MSSFNSPVARFGALLIVPVIFGSITPMLISNFSGADTPARIAIAVALLFPLGLYMGMAFPIGMLMTSGAQRELTPWLWGINGATSVCASVLAVAIALNFGITDHLLVRCSVLPAGFSLPYVGITKPRRKVSLAETPTV